jgi:hypothetical protein
MRRFYVRLEYSGLWTIDGQKEAALRIIALPPSILRRSITESAIVQRPATTACDSATIAAALRHWRSTTSRIDSMEIGGVDRTILIVDDEADISLVLRMVAGKPGPIHYLARRWQRPIGHEIRAQ